MKVKRLNAVLIVLVLAGVTAAIAAARVDGPRKVTTITFWDAYSAQGPEVQHLEKVIIPAFEKSHPGVFVKDVTIPYDSLHTKLVTATAGGQLPDLVRSDIIWVPELANLGVLAPLDQVMPSFKSLSGQVFAGPLATNYWKGHYYGLPLDTNTRIWVYNPKALQRSGRPLRRRPSRSCSRCPRPPRRRGCISTPRAEPAAGTSCRGSGRTAAR